MKARKMCFIIFLNETTPFLDIKSRSSKSRKIDIFPKGLVHGFGPKWVIFFFTFCLSNIGREFVFYHILERKIAFLGYKNKKFRKSKNWEFSKGVSSWFWSKIGHFSNVFFSGEKGQENVF